MEWNAKKLTLQYCALQGAYWMLYCTLYSFATVFLLEKGFENAQIGVVVALGNVLGVILQPVFASVADSSEKISVHKLTALLSAAGLALLFLLFVLPELFLPVAVLFLLTDALVQIIQPMINSVSMYYINRGVEVDFGVARGVGSVAFAIISYLLGILVKIWHSAAILVIGMLLLAVIVLVLFSMPVFRETAREERKEKEEKEAAPKRRDAGQKTQAGFLFRYQGFVFVLTGLTLLFITHAFLNNYLIQIMTPLGGGSAEMGTAMSIAALAEVPTMFLFSRVVKRISSGRLLVVSSVFFTIKAAALLFAPNIGTIYLAHLLQCGGFAICIPASVYYANSIMEENDKVKGQALMAGTNTLGGVFGSLLGGFLLDGFGVRVMLIVGCAISVLGMVLLALCVGKGKETVSGDRAAV